MALALHTRAVDDNNKAYTAIQGWNTNPADIRMPDSVNTRRPKLSNREIASRYLKSVEGNPNIDINKKTQTSAGTGINSHSVATQNTLHQNTMKRSDACDIGKKKFTWFRDQCKGTYFTEYKLKYMDLRPNVVRELIGSSNHECLCMNDLAEFVVCSDENIGEVVDSIAYLWPRQVINYRNPFLIPSQFNPCGHYWQACLEPASTPDEINLQIDAALNHIPATRIYLNQTQLDNYLKWRKTNRSSEEFPYIRVSDKPSEPAKDDVALKVITGVFGVTGLLALISHPFLRSLRGPKVEADTNPTTVTIPPSQPVSPESISHSDSEVPSAQASKKPSLKTAIPLSLSR